MSTDKLAIIWSVYFDVCRHFLTQVRGSYKCKSFLYVHLVDGGVQRSIMNVRFNSISF